jgi:hypothetical protein
LTTPLLADDSLAYVDPLWSTREPRGRVDALLPCGCRMGICDACVARLRSGALRDLRTGEVHDTPGELVQTCVSAAAGPVEIDLTTGRPHPWTRRPTS